MRKLMHFVSVVLLTIFPAGCNLGTQDDPDQHFDSFPASNSQVPLDDATLIPVEKFSSDYFPCNDCHIELVPNPQRRELVEMHDDIVFDHDSENRWCLACHSMSSRDSLVLASGKLLGFDESYKLCGQCHGPKYRDWKLGIHGKRTGEWNGLKEYLLCVHCHNPHSPRFESLDPLPPPRRPEMIYTDSIYEQLEENPTSP